MVSTPLVLVADDEPQMRDIVAGHLRSLHDPRLEVVEAADGEQAWKLACEKLPDLVVLDVRMPEMSGWEVCKKIREAVALAHTGVIMLTGIGERLNEITSPLYGADAYIDKPFQLTDLDRKVKDVLAERAPQRNAVPRPRENGVHAPARPAKSLARTEPRAAKGKSTSAKPGAKKAASGKPVANSAGKVAGKAKASLAKKAPAKKAPAKKAPAKKAPAKKAPAKKAPAKKAPAKKAAKGKKR